MAISLKHELRTPLNHILGYCEMLIEDAEDRQETELLPGLQRIHVSGRRLLTAINDLLDVSKSGGRPLDARSFQDQLEAPLGQIIDGSRLLEEEATQRGHLSVVPDIRRIHASARQLRALTSEHLGPARLAAGVPAGADSPAVTFVRRPAGQAEAVSTPRSPGLAPPETGHLLLVDDNPLTLDMLARRLERLGHRISRATSGQEALEQVRAQPFDLVLLDLVMPGLSGHAVLEHLKKDPARRGLAVIVLSAADQTEDVARCIEAGAEDYLSKPFDPVVLQARINACLEKKRLRDREVSHLRQIDEERKRSEELLHVILPADVAAELKTTHAVRPRRVETVGVLFCDIAGFTAYCEQHEPEVVLAHLQALVERFEVLALEHDLEKMKTIGDSFMATAGLQAPLENPALSCVRCGLAMIAAATARPPYWSVRVGVHVGPVIAGVVGHRKYQYDIWGDTVNMASRMEQAAAPGSIYVNAETWASLRAHCHGRSLGTLPVKGKGEQEVYVVERLLA